MSATELVSEMVQASAVYHSLSVVHRPLVRSLEALEGTRSGISLISIALEQDDSDFSELAPLVMDCAVTAAYFANKVFDGKVDYIRSRLDAMQELKPPFQRGDATFAVVCLEAIASRLMDMVEVLVLLTEGTVEMPKIAFPLMDPMQLLKHRVVMTAQSKRIDVGEHLRPVAQKLVTARHILKRQSETIHGLSETGLKNAAGREESHRTAKERSAERAAICRAIAEEIGPVGSKRNLALLVSRHYAEKYPSSEWRPSEYVAYQLLWPPKRKTKKRVT